ncbi:AraC family transcriptional regulator [Streptomyces coacervatus]|uniref:AraC family transcriptional regulator n=1 Tax=Streptomyces coacervatus TaxID=647381 RepID=A0ABP7I110_9ACTN|nr:AraC family transcriptional regulator [Streptomyces coacervatus]MDF2269471.1 AraC family transcriptional regulator [Streptomyces coacervatus]
MKVSRSSGTADPLADLVRLLRLRPSTFKRLSSGTRWTATHPEGGALDIAAVQRGRWRVADESGTIALDAGDVVVLTGATEFRLISEADEATILIGHYELATTNSELLKALLPPTCHVRAGDRQAPAVNHLVDLLVREVIDRHPGAELMIERLAELVLVEVLRGIADTSDSRTPALLHGLADPVVAAALRAVHQDVARPWTVAELARTTAVSRSVFAERFTAVTGLAPMAYLLRWRMALAKDAIAHGDQSHTQIAYAVGYSSISSFSTAFKRHVGQSPAQFARTLTDR